MNDRETSAAINTDARSPFRWIWAVVGAVFGYLNGELYFYLSNLYISLLPPGEPSNLFPVVQNNPLLVKCLSAAAFGFGAGVAAVCSSRSRQRSAQ